MLTPISLTYGDLPTDLVDRCKEVAPYRIGIHWNSRDGETIRYVLDENEDIQFTSSMDSCGRDVLIFDSHNLSHLIRKLVETWEENYEIEEESGDFAASILSTLEVEWI